MSEMIETGGPAFPCDGVTPTNENGHFYGHAISSFGLTIRDYFAAKAMQGFCSGSFWGEANNDECAVAAYAMADAMLKAREVKNGQG